MKTVPDQKSVLTGHGWDHIRHAGRGECVRRTSIRARLSTLKFPEMCPACLKSPPEDLVAVTIIERPEYDRHLEDTIALSKRNDIDITLTTASGAVTLFIPTCLHHGSKSLRTLRTRLSPAIAFFLLFYPILFFMMQLNIAYTTHRDTIQPLIMLALSLTVMLISCAYGMTPRALERSIKFRDISGGRDQITIEIANQTYASAFLESNTDAEVIGVRGQLPLR